MRVALIALTLLFGLSTHAQARKLIFKDCNNTEEKDIRATVKWLKNNFDKISGHMGKRGLMAWPGKSKKKLRKKLFEKDIKFRCIGDKKKCQPKDDGGQLRGRTVPVLHQKRVALCTNVLDDQADMAAVIMHELAHLVRLNKHKSKCEDRCRAPRFSESVEQATFSAHTGKNYSASDCVARCP